MMVGCLDTGDALATGLSVTVNGLGSEFTSGGYDVIVYALGGVGGRGGAYTINGTTKYATSPTMPTTHTEDAGAGVADMGTYVRFTGLSGSSFTLTANASSADNPTNTVNFRAPVNGIQIVAHQSSDIPIFSYNANFDSGLPVGTTPSGNTPPAVNAGHLVLTRNGVTSEQNFWTVPLTGVPVLQSLHASWKSLINGPGGADGYSFNFGQNVGTGFTAEEGGNSGLSVTVDTYNNGGNETGIETRWNGARLSFTPIAGGAPNGPPELSKNQFVNATVDVTPSGQVTFNYDGFVTVGQIPSYVGLNANQIVFGARTGGASEDAFIDDLSVAGFAPGACGSESSQTVHFIVSNDNPSIFSAQPAISGNGTLMYTPAANANGVANVSVVAQDDGGALYGGSDTSAQQTFAITINAVNDCPTASGPSGPLTVISGASAAVPITASDIEGDPLSAGIVTPPSHGALSGTGLNVTYTANAGYVGPDSFVLAVTDGQCNSAAIPVSVNVIPIPNPNRPPTCVASIVPPTCTLNVANDGKTYVIALNGGACVLLDSAGSSDPDGDALTVTWTVDNTNHLSGAAVPVCLDLGCHSIEMVVSDGRDVCRKHIDLCVISGGEAIEQVVTLLDGMNLDRKNKRPLIASLKAAVASYDKGDHEHTAANQLNAFQNKCRAQIGRNNPADAAALIKAAQDVVDAVDCAEQVLAAQQGN